MAKPDMSDAWAESGSTTNPGAAKIVLGWIAEIPTFQVFNWLLNRIDTFLQHINEQGVASWDNATLYVEGAKVLASDNANYKLPIGAGTSLNEDPTAGAPWIKEVIGEANDWEAGQVITEDTVAFAASQALDFGVNQNNIITLTADMTLTAFNNAKAGGVYVVRLKQDATSGWAVTWPANVRWTAGIVPILSSTTNEQDLVSFYYTGTQFLGNHSGAYPV